MASAALAADPWADRVVRYTPGTGAVSGFQTAATSLGSPERFTGESSPFPAAVTPFSPAFGADEIVSIGAGGELVVAFDEPVVNDPLNPFGLDLIVFGNAGFIDQNFPLGETDASGSMFGVGISPLVQVSANGTTWFTVSAQVDSTFPTLGYLDLLDPFAVSPGAVPSDFTKPVNPAFNPGGLSYAQLLAGYDGSGGGTGIDIAPTGLSSISFVRFFNTSTAPASFEIDALADVAPVPAPGVLGAASMIGALNLTRRRRRAT